MAFVRQVGIGMLDKSDTMALRHRRRQPQVQRFAVDVSGKTISSVVDTIHAFPGQRQWRCPGKVWAGRYDRARDGHDAGRLEPSVLRKSNVSRTRCFTARLVVGGAWLSWSRQILAYNHGEAAPHKSGAASAYPGGLLTSSQYAASQRCQVALDATAARCRRGCRRSTA
jgi:hypothetical protein